MVMPGDLRKPRWLYLKAVLLLCVGVLASALLLVESPRLRTAGLLVAAVWGFCRAYYFAFYVVEKYADPGFKFSGLISFVRYVFSRRRANWSSRERDFNHRDTEAQRKSEEKKPQMNADERR